MSIAAANNPVEHPDPLRSMRLPVRDPAITDVYLSGPMTGLPFYNYPAFNEAAQRLTAAGYEVYNPASTVPVLDTSHALTGTEPVPGFDLRSAFNAYADFITSSADAVAVLPGWEASSGARAEVALARAIGLPILDALSGARLDVALAASSTPAEKADGLDVGTHDGTHGGSHDGTVAEVVDMAAVDACMSRHPAGKRRSGPALVDASVSMPDPASAPAAGTTSSGGEVRVVSATGGQKGTKEAAFALIPAGPLRELAVLYGRGQMKYPDAVSGAPNWKRGYPWSLSKSALERHLNLFWAGEDYDPEMGVKHLICVAWHAFNMAWFLENRPEFDDRPKDEHYGGALPTPQALLDLIAARGDQP